jgi:Fic family protein
VKGRVAHSRISDVDQDVVRYRSGVEFIEPSERVAAVIAEFIELLRQSQITAAPHITQIDSAD